MGETGIGPGLAWGELASPIGLVLSRRLVCFSRNYSAGSVCLDLQGNEIVDEFSAPNGGVVLLSIKTQNPHPRSAFAFSLKTSALLCECRKKKARALMSPKVRSTRWCLPWKLGSVAKL